MKINSVLIHNFRSIKEQLFTFKDYITLIGPNNAGKSNIIAALRFFFGDYSPKQEYFFCDLNGTCDELFVEVEFKNIPEDNFAELPEQYQLDDNTLKVRRYMQINQSADYYAYVKEEQGVILSDTTEVAPIGWTVQRRF